MIPESEWVWHGHQCHFICPCKFHMATRIGHYLISTVGDYFPKGSDTRDQIGAGADAFFETFVFLAGHTMGCGCTELADASEIDGIRYATALEAQAGHMAMCREYAAKQDREA